MVSTAISWSSSARVVGCHRGDMALLVIRSVSAATATAMSEALTLGSERCGAARCPMRLANTSGTLTA
jgi:hypothetical protein